MIVAVAQPFLMSHATTLSVRITRPDFVVTPVEKVPSQNAVTDQVVVGVDELCGV